VVESEVLAVATSLRNLQVSTGWMDSIKKKHNIVWNGVCGESVVSEYKPKLLELISPYKPKNIGHYQQNHSWLREKSVLGATCPKKDLQCNCVGTWWEKWKSSKIGMFQEPEN
jgi:hypothetical protein